MSFMQDLVNIYDANWLEVGVVNSLGNDEEPILLPRLYKKSKISFIVSCTIHGELIDIRAVNKSRLIPCTLTSMARSSGSAPHILHDNCKYVAVDSGENSIYYENYLNQLKTYQHLHPIYKAVYHLVQKYPMWSLIQSKLTEKNSLNPNDTYIYFEVEEGPGCFYNQCNEQFYNDHWQQQSNHFGGNLTESICFISGERNFILDKHPKGIRSSGDSPKLISRPTNSSFITFEPKFKTVTDAYSIGVEASIKAHNALSWLIEKQGVRNGGRIYLMFSTKNIPIEDLFSFNLNRSDKQLDTQKIISLREVFKGKYHTIHLENEEYVYIVLDSTDDKGRLSVLDYQRFTPVEYEQILSNWDEARSYHLTYNSEYMISFYDIIRATYWDFKNKKMRIKEKPQKNLSFKIRSAVIRKEPLPPFFEDMLIKETLKATILDKKEWNRRLMTLLAVRRYNCHLKEENFVEYNRSYLFGQVAALLEKIEERVLSKKNDEEKTRATSMERLMTKFYQTPAQTYSFIYQKLTPYFVSLKKENIGAYIALKREIDQLITEINKLEGFTNDMLDAKFFVGYSEKKVEMYKNAKVQMKNKLESEGVLNHVTDIETTN